ncbi:MAG: mechanosensitive ion channel [Alphaproteobacteria bacterium]|nr:mechanosensitive ion channel [Alphaproteobacteria bacterium]
MGTKMWTKWLKMLALSAVVLASALADTAAQEGPDPSRAVTHLEPMIAPARLDLLVQPLTQSELLDEVAAWQGLLQASVAELNDVQLRLRKINAIEAAREAGEEPRAAELVGSEVDVADRERLSEQAGELLARRSTLLDRFKVVVDAYEAKGGDPAAFRTYARAVSGVKVDWTDPQSAWKTISEWATSEEGGLRLAQRVGVFAAVLVAAYVAGAVISWIFAAGFSFAGSGSKLLRRFVVRWSRRVVFFIGAMIGLSALGVNVTPLVAALGAAGFVVGFALQSTLSNFASGLLLMTQRPFDVGDVVEAAGVTGVIQQVSLFNTQIDTFDNKKMVIPNNSIWEGTITNSTASEQRRLDMEFDVAEGIVTEEAERTLNEVVSGHAQVLGDPEPVIKFDGIVPAASLGAATEPGSWKRFVVRFWAKTPDLYAVRWDLIRAMETKLGAGAIRRVT